MIEKRYALFMAITACIMSLPFSSKLYKDTGDLIFFHLSVFSGVFLSYRTFEYLPFKKKSFSYIKPAIIIIGTIAVITALYQPIPINQFILAGVLLVFYYLPIIPANNEEPNGFRSILLVKNLIIALCWALITSPFFENQNENADLLFVFRILYVFGLSVAIDIKDLKEDQENNHQTLANTIGIQKTKTLSILCICIAALIFYTNYHTNDYRQNYIPAHGLFTALCIGFIKEKTKKNSTIIIVDGNLMFHAIISGIIIHY